MKKRLYEEFLHAICHEGSANDSLPTSRSTGPLVEIFESVVKPSHRLGRNERHMRMRTFYTDVGHGRRSSPSNQSNSFATSCSPLTLPVKAKKYKRCRLPLVSRRVTEMREVTKWIESAFEEKGLKTNTVDEAFDICKVIIEKHNLAGGRAAVDSPNGTDPNNALIDCGSMVTNEANVVEPQNAPQVHQADVVDFDAAGGYPPGTSTDGSPPEISPPFSHGNRGTGTAAVITGSSDDAQSHHISDDDIALRHTMEKALDMAKDDKKFMVLCSLFEEQNETFGLFSGVYLEECRRSRTELSDFMKQVLLFAHWKKFGIVDRREHENREMRLRKTMVLLVAARRGLGLKSYEEMQWGFTR